MTVVSAPNIEEASLEPAARAFSSPFFSEFSQRIETFLEAERAQLALWLVAAFGGGIAAWFWIGGAAAWSGFILLSLALGAAGVALGREGRLGPLIGGCGLAMAIGCGLIWWRAESAASPRLDRPRIVTFAATVETVQPLPAKGDIRLLLAPARNSRLPPRVRVSVKASDSPPSLRGGAVILLQARLQPPPPMALPGTHDFARDAWFARIGAVGRATGKVTEVRAGAGGGLERLRLSLDARIRSRLAGSAGGIATALVTGDQAAVSEDDADAMRRSGLTHLLSVSGLHIAAVIGAVMFLTMRLLALSPAIALRFNLVLVSAAIGALAGIGYTLLTGMQVPTVRSCVAALLILGGIVLGRDPLSLRLVAVGALAVLMFRPEAIAGASFQLSFAAVTAIVAVHSIGPVRALTKSREEGWAMRVLRSLGGLLITGLAVELALIPFALYHFHRAGLYGVVANLVGIPLTTFAIMPLEALALLAEPTGLSGPLWSATGAAIRLLLSLAHHVASAKGAVALLPTMPRPAFALMVIGMLWFALWSGRIRWWGGAPLLLGILLAAAAPSPDLLVTGDGRHLAVMRPDGTPLLLRAKAGDYMRDLIAESAAFDGDPLALEEEPGVDCTRDACVADIQRGGRAWRLLALRSKDRIEWRRLMELCSGADIVVTDHRLPTACHPRWLKLDRAALEDSGGLAISLGTKPSIDSVASRLGDHPWKAVPPVWQPFGVTHPGEKRKRHDNRQRYSRRTQSSPPDLLHTASSLPDGSMK